MIKKLVALVAFGLLISSCGDGRAPKNQDEACSILNQRPGWNTALKNTEREWGVRKSVVMAIIWKESSFRPRARPRDSNGDLRSSAYGYPQALDGTWEWYQEATRNFNHKRTNFAHATNFVGWYANESQRRSGINRNDAYNLYLTYHQGHGGFNRGSHLRQGWLLQVARQVSVREAKYRAQLPYCTNVR